MFDEYKNNCLSKLDKSRKGNVDVAALILVNKLNSLSDYYTTSSCAGRIMVVRGNSKYKMEWLLQSHDAIVVDEIKILLGDSKGDIWFKMEPSIFHVCCRDLDSSLSLLAKVRSVGYKKGGIQTVGKKIMLEFVGPEVMETILVKNGEVLVDDRYLIVLAREATERLEKTQQRIRRVVELFPVN